MGKSSVFKLVERRKKKKVKGNLRLIAIQKDYLKGLEIGRELDREYQERLSREKEVYDDR
jgi:hypothetical protein